MNRTKLINRLVARKMNSLGKAKVICVCFAGTSAAAQRPLTNRKN